MQSDAKSQSVLGVSCRYKTSDSAARQTFLSPTPWSNLNTMKPIKPLLFFMACSAVGASSSPPDFQRDVLPILSRRCLQCHGEAVQMGNLDLRSPASMLKGGNKGLTLIKGSAQQSLLYQRIVDQSMPMGEEKLTEEEIGLIGAWINSGASSDTSGTAEASKNEQPVTRHWAFVPPQRPPVPQVNDDGWARSPVDAFILQELEKRGIRPSPPADRRTLLRRVYLDLIGLPPTAEEVEAFLQDESAGAYGRVVEDLLSRPQYGERWARHWLDVVRYAETNGYERDGTKPLRQGLLNETLVVWAGEFGRTPTSQNNVGRDHSPRGFSTWIAGGGVRGGQTVGATDDFGYAAVENKVHVHDLHATILHLMGMDHTLLTYFHAGRDMRLTDVHGRVVPELLA